MKEVKDFKERAMKMCSCREYCRKEVLDRLIKWGCTSSEARDIVDYLVAHFFIDESRYAQAFVNDKLRIGKWGRKKIAYHLRLQNIDKEIIADMFSAIDENEYLQMMIDVLQKKFKTMRLRENIFETKANLYRFAASRGFEPEIANDLISDMVDSEMKKKC